MFKKNNLLHKINLDNINILSTRFLFDSIPQKKLVKLNILIVVFLSIYKFFKIILKINYHFLSKKKENTALNTKNYKKKNLIISHKNTSNNSDYIFGNNFDDKYKLKSNFLYLNNVNNESKNTKLSKEILLFNYFTQIKVLIKLYIICFKYMIGYDSKNKDSDFDNIKYHLALSYLNEDTFYNLIIFEIIKNKILIHEYKNILTTYEGHPWEILIFYYIKKLKKVFVYAYLHSYLKKNSPYLHLNYKYQPNYLYVVSNTMKKSISNNLSFDNNQIIILGSKKFNPYKKSNKNLSRKIFRNILLLPEAIKEEVDIFLKFIDIFKKHKNLNIKIKLHPLFKFSHHNIKKYNKYIYRGNLDDIDKKFEVILYRGTTAIFDIIQYDILCLYLYDINNFTNPIFENLFDFYIDINDNNSLFEIEKNLNSNQFFINKYNKIKKDYHNYFEPFNKNLLP